MRYPKQKSVKGFTLIEVMVALAILAVVAVSASQASRSYLQSVGNMKTRMLAQFVAQNTITDLRLQQKWITQVENKQVDEQGKKWQITITPTDTSISSLKKISVVVAPVDEQGQVGHGIVSLDTVLTKPMGVLP